MTHPTDDELEAMAVDMMFFQPGETSDQAAAMLRACKGRVRGLPRSDGDGGWTLPMELLQDLEREVMAQGWDGCTAEVTEIIALSVERRILYALDTAPDHSEWNAAIQSAIDACTNVIKSYDVMDETGTKYLPMKTQKAAKGMVSIAREDIGKLKKGPPHD